MKIAFITFNIGKAGMYENGPGMCLFNLVKILKAQGHQVDIYSKLQSKYSKPLQSITKYDIVHHWSGLSIEYLEYLNGNINIIGPNVLDGVNETQERIFLSKIKNKNIKFLVVNPHIKNNISKKYNIGSVQEFMVGPDLNEWAPSNHKDSFILWKGNSNHYAKDINFALQVKDKLIGKYEFKFIGHPKPYSYLEHISIAKRAKIYYTTSISETMGLAVLEQMACKVPVIANPNVYMGGIHMGTGIITEKVVANYCDAIDLIMQDNNLHSRLSDGAFKFVNDNFNDEIIYKNYLDIIGSN